MDSLTGLWKGTLTYRDGYGDDAGKILYFEFRLHQKGNEIIGTAIDKEGFARNSSIADIEGEIHDNEFVFIKQYRWTPETESEGPEIFYQGTFDVTEQKVIGTWHIKAYRTNIKGADVEFMDSNGDWYINREI